MNFQPTFKPTLMNFIPAVVNASNVPNIGKYVFIDLQNK